MAGPFVEYAPPGVYTQTNLDPAVVGLLGNLRIPAIIGTAEEVKTAQGYDLARGSSASRDQKKVDELQTGFTGTNKDFTVDKYPIVVGDNTGRVTNNLMDVFVKVNDVQVIVAKVEGAIGKVTLALAPKVSDVVTCTYFYKLTDTKVIDEVHTLDVDGVTTTFYTNQAPIVDGSNAGKTTTEPSRVTVKVNGSIEVVTLLDGANGAFTLATAPMIGDTLTITYYWNMFANTADDLPFPNPTRIIRVGMSPETSDFIENVDFAIIDNQIQWGTGYKLVVADHGTGCEIFDDSQVTGQLIDDRIRNEDVSSQFTGTEKILTVDHFPIVDGTGRDIVTQDPTKVIVTVNGIPVTVTRVDGETGKIYLKIAPLLGDDVLVTYWFSRITDDTYAMEVILAGPSGVGTYEVTSTEVGQIGVAVPGLYSAPGITGGPEFLDFGPTTGSANYTVNETVTLTFTSATQFSVTSTDLVNGSFGSGVVNSTYIDAKTGLMFTLATPTGTYATADYVEIIVTKNATFTTSVTPITSIPGMRVIVDNTTDCCAADITNLITFNKSGNEPNVGDTYYITYQYTKTDYECKVFSKFKDITNEYGDISPNNPITLSSYIMFQNGAIVLICCQTKKATNSDIAADPSYYEVIDRLKFPVQGINPSVMFPVTTSQSVIEYTVQHCDVMSSKRMRRERTTMFGFAVGTEPLDAADYAYGINNSRAVAVYPDGAQIQLVAPDGSVGTFVVDGTYLAAALIGVNVSTAYDVAEPMTRKPLIGFTALVREMDEATSDMVATKGVTIIQRTSAQFIVRHCLTTNMVSTLTREYNVTTVRDFIQQEARRVLDQFIGKKFISTLTTDVSSTLGNMLRAAKDANIIVDYKGVSAERDSVQPDFIRATAFYIPIVGLNWIEVTFNIRIRF